MNSTFLNKFYFLNIFYQHVRHIKLSSSTKIMLWHWLANEVASTDLTCKIYSYMESGEEARSLLSSMVEGLLRGATTSSWAPFGNLRLRNSVQPCHCHTIWLSSAPSCCRFTRFSLPPQCCNLKDLAEFFSAQSALDQFSSIYTAAE